MYMMLADYLRGYSHPTGSSPLHMRGLDLHESMSTPGLVDSLEWGKPCDIGTETHEEIVYSSLVLREAILLLIFVYTVESHYYGNPYGHKIERYIPSFWESQCTQFLCLGRCKLS